MEYNHDTLFFSPTHTTFKKISYLCQCLAQVALTRESGTTFGENKRKRFSDITHLVKIWTIFNGNRVMGNKRLPLVVYICVQPMLYPYAIGVGRVVLSELQGVQTLTVDKNKHVTTLSLYNDMKNTSG